jgi:tetratricopeptide (TPR) repeat protein
MSDSNSPELLQLQINAQKAIHAADESWKAREPARMIAALQACDAALQALPAETLVEQTEAPDPSEPLARERALLWLWRGRLLVMADKSEVVVQGLHSLDQAIARFRAAGEREGAEEALAIAWMNRGSGLFRLESRDALAEAVRSYDQAIQLLERGPEGMRNALGAAWMNRGVGLMHLEQVKDTKEDIAARLAEAAKSLERAAVVLEPLAPGERAAQHNLASTWSNIGMIRSRQEDAPGAMEAHRKAVDLFRPLVAAANDAGETFELAARLFNLGQACGAAGDTEAALAAGREALSVAGSVKTNDPQALELMLRTRHALCVVLGGQLASGRTKSEDPQRPARLEEAGDLVEDGLADLRGRGELPAGLAAAGARLYEFGAWFYRTQQPQFLGEFLLEHLADDKDRARIAAAAVQAARQAFVQRNFNDTAHGDMNRVLDILQELGEVETRIKALGVA